MLGLVGCWVFGGLCTKDPNIGAYDIRNDV